MSTAKGTGITPLKAPHRVGRAALLLLGMSSLVTGIWGGLLRVPVPLPLPVEHANWISFHGPLMVCGFLGTLISLERAVGLRALWTYLVPLLDDALRNLSQWRSIRSVAVLTLVLAWESLAPFRSEDGSRPRFRPAGDVLTP